MISDLRSWEVKKNEISQMNFANKTVLITGASSGIGEALARNLSKENCRLALAARRIALLEKLSGELKLNGCDPLVVKCDVSKKEEVSEAWRQVKNKFGGIDVAILNSGAGHKVTVDNYDSKFAEEIFGANLFGIIYWVEQLLPEYFEKKKGTIVGISSLADNRGFSESGFYSSSKAAVSIYLEGLRVELNPYGIKVITVKPGFIKTPMTDKNNFKMPFIMSPEKAAEIILGGIKKEKRIIQFPWQTVFLSRLVGLLPGSIYEWLAGSRLVEK